MGKYTNMAESILKEIGGKRKYINSCSLYDSSSFYFKG